MKSICVFPRLALLYDIVKCFPAFGIGCRFYGAQYRFFKFLALAAGWSSLKSSDWRVGVFTFRDWLDVQT